MPVVETQGQIDSIYFDFSKAFDVVPHKILLNKLSNFGLSTNYVNWFENYLTDRQSCVRLGNLSRFHLIVYVEFLKGLHWDLSYFYYL